MTEKFWFTSQLFVRLETQAKGIGQALLSKTLMQAERNGAANRALITPAYNIASTGLYLKNGLCPRELLYRMAAPASAVRAGRTSVRCRKDDIVRSGVHDESAGINDPEFERRRRRLQPFATDNMPLDAAFATAIRAGNWPMHSPKHGSDRLREMIGSSMLAAQHVGSRLRFGYQ